HVRFCESVGAKLPHATHLVILSRGHAEEAPTYRHQACTTAYPTRSQHRVVILATCSPGSSASRTSQNESATVMLGFSQESYTLEQTTLTPLGVRREFQRELAELRQCRLGWTLVNSSARFSGGERSRIQAASR